jgi:putative membrane protein
LTVDQATQAAVLRALFINQGVYNLMAAVAGMTALYFIKRGDTATGNAFVVYTCLFGMVAAATLILSTHAYALGAAQLAFPAVTLLLVRKSSSSSTPRTD